MKSKKTIVMLLTLMMIIIETLTGCASATKKLSSQEWLEERLSQLSIESYKIDMSIKKKGEKYTIKINGEQVDIKLSEEDINFASTPINYEKIYKNRNKEERKFQEAKKIIYTWIPSLEIAEEDKEKALKYIEDIPLKTIDFSENIRELSACFQENSVYLKKGLSIPLSAYVHELVHAVQSILSEQDDNYLRHTALNEAITEVITSSIMNEESKECRYLLVTDYVYALMKIFKQEQVINAYLYGYKQLDIKSAELEIYAFSVDMYLHEVNEYAREFARTIANSQIVYWMSKEENSL